MRVWRICRATHEADALAGRGGLYASGRWHSRGQLIVYCSESLALAALEVLVHVDRRIVPVDLIQVSVEIPDTVTVENFPIADLQDDWQKYPAPAQLLQFGDRWLAEMRTAVLRVPSALIPEESNVLLNPRHPDMVNIRSAPAKRFVYNNRLIEYSGPSCH